MTAIDGRIENVVKTIVRCSMFDRHPTVLTCDLERAEPAAQRLQADLCHHVGVLYHLSDPVRHLRQLGTWIGRGLMLDTHYSEPETAEDAYEVDGERFRFKHFGEGRADPFSGMESHAKWLTLDDITGVLRGAGFDDGGGRGAPSGAQRPARAAVRREVGDRHELTPAGPLRQSGSAAR